MSSCSSPSCLPLSTMIAAFSSLLFLPGFADSKLTVQPAVSVQYETEVGKFYQLEIKREKGWEAVGFARPGTGKPIEGLYPSGEYRVTIPSQKWVKVWADEFDGPGLDYGKWGKVEDNYGGGNKERQAYRADEKYCQIKDGILNLSVYRDPHTTSDGKTQPYSSARIRTRKRGDWKYGKFEVRAKVPSGQGMWPAIWMLPTEPKYGVWASSGEIDILESMGSKVGETSGALHFGGTWPKNTFLNHHYTFPNKNGADDFHVYTLEWLPDEIKWYVDGVLCRTREKKEWFSEAAKDNPRAPYDQPFHLVVNLAVDGYFFEGTDQSADSIPDEKFPQTLQIDYIRVFQWAN